MISLYVDPYHVGVVAVQMRYVPTVVEVNPVASIRVAREVMVDGDEVDALGHTLKQLLTKEIEGGENHR
jgi:hypothetical protein